MSIVPRTLGMLSVGWLSACSVAGPPTLVPPPADMHSDLVKPTGTAVLAAPAGWKPAPTLVTPVFPVDAPHLLAAMQDILLAAPRTWLTVAYPDQGQAFLMVRSAHLNLPDVVVVQALAEGPSASRAVIFSQSRLDAFPLISVNRERVRGLIEALTRRFGIRDGATPGH